MRATYELRKMMVYFNGEVLNKEIHIPVNYEKFVTELKLTDVEAQKAIGNQMTAFQDYIKMYTKVSGRVKIVGISGSLRKMSTNTAAIKFAASLLPKDRFSFELLDYSDLSMYNGDDEAMSVPANVRKLHAQILGADAIIFGCPEYNYSVSGVLKNMIDWVSRV